MLLLLYIVYVGQMLSQVWLGQDLHVGIATYVYQIIRGGVSGSMIHQPELQVYNWGDNFAENWSQVLSTSGFSQHQVGQVEAGVADSLCCHGAMCYHRSPRCEQPGLPEWVHQCGAKPAGKESNDPLCMKVTYCLANPFSGVVLSEYMLKAERR